MVDVVNYSHDWVEVEIRGIKYEARVKNDGMNDCKAWWNEIQNIIRMDESDFRLKYRDLDKME